METLQWLSQLEHSPRSRLRLPSGDLDHDGATVANSLDVKAGCIAPLAADHDADSLTGDGDQARVIPEPNCVNDCARIQRSATTLNTYGELPTATSQVSSHERFMSGRAAGGVVAASRASARRNDAGRSHSRIRAFQ